MRRRDGRGDFLYGHFLLLWFCYGILDLAKEFRFMGRERVRVEYHTRLEYGLLRYPRDVFRDA
jgi:hypothetical protein